MHLFRVRWLATSRIGRASVEFMDGAISVLVGASGVGKTTCLRLVAGILTPTSGAFNWGDVAEPPDVRLRRRFRRSFRG